MNNVQYCREACVDTLTQASRAVGLGAARLELCSRLDLDGLSPSAELLSAVLATVDVPVHAMVRPRPGNFVYSSPSEQDEMLRTIDHWRALGAHGVVFGALDIHQHLDLRLLERLTRHAAGMRVTIHKAIDRTPDPLAALKELLEIPGIYAVLTSGGAATAAEGAAVLGQMIALAGDQLEIIVAGKVTKDNLESLHLQLQARAYHGRLIVGTLDANA